MTTTPALALEIRAEMTRQQITAADLATRCEYSVHQVQRRLTGSVELTVADALAFSTALGVPLYALLQRTETGRAA